jgi:hypothetical protein
LAYEAGRTRPGTAAEPVVPQPFADFFQPENRILLAPQDGAVTCDGNDAAARWRAAGSVPVTPVPAAPSAPRGRPWRSFDEAGFTAVVQRAREYIAAGDIYQVNLALAERWRFAVPLGCLSPAAGGEPVAVDGIRRFRGLVARVRLSRAARGSHGGGGWTRRADTTDRGHAQEDR